MVIHANLDSRQTSPTTNTSDITANSFDPAEMAKVQRLRLRKVIKSQFIAWAHTMRYKYTMAIAMWLKYSIVFTLNGFGYGWARYLYDNRLNLNHKVYRKESSLQLNENIMVVCASGSNVKFRVLKCISARNDKNGHIYVLYFLQ